MLSLARCVFLSLLLSRSFSLTCALLDNPAEASTRAAHKLNTCISTAERDQNEEELRERKRAREREREKVKATKRATTQNDEDATNTTNKCDEQTAAVWLCARIYASRKRMME